MLILPCRVVDEDDGPRVLRSLRTGGVGLVGDVEICRGIVKLVTLPLRSICMYNALFGLSCVWRVECGRVGVLNTEKAHSFF